MQVSASSSLYLKYLCANADALHFTAICREYTLKGQLVPDSVISELVAERLQQSPGGWLLEGYPRTVEQAAHLDAVAKPERVINILLDETVAERKMMGRRVCRCGSCFMLSCTLQLQFCFACAYAFSHLHLCCVRRFNIQSCIIASLANITSSALHTQEVRWQLQCVRHT
jgi:adenylate kinase family enzyme